MISQSVRAGDSYVEEEIAEVQKFKSKRSRS